MQEWLGAESSDNGPTFDPSHVIWMPDRAFQVGAFYGNVGAPAPSPGSPLAVSPAVPVAVPGQMDKGTAAPPSDKEWEIVIGETVFPYTGNIGAPLADCKGLAHFAAQKTGTIQARLRLKSDESSWTVPPSAVRAESSMRCVYIANDSEEWLPVAVEILGGSLNDTRISPRGVQTFDSLDRVRVVVNPAQLIELPACQ